MLMLILQLTLSRTMSSYNKITTNNSPQMRYILDHIVLRMRNVKYQHFVVLNRNVSQEVYVIMDKNKQLTIATITLNVYLDVV